jgi:hypothetical protein
MVIIDTIDVSDVTAVGVTGFEPALSCTQGRRADQLPYTPKWISGRAWPFTTAALRPLRSWSGR